MATTRWDGFAGCIETGPEEAAEFLVSSDELRVKDNGGGRNYRIGQFQTGRRFTADADSFMFYGIG
jgi:hypothetical protein